MKRSIPILALLCMLLGIPGSPARADDYQIVTEEWAPYNYQENGQLTGMTTEIVRAIMALTGDHFEIALVPSMRTTYLLNSRPKTILYSLFRTPEREPLYKWVGPIVEESIYPYQLADAQQPVNTLEELHQAPQITTRKAGLIPDLLQAQGFNNLDRSASVNQQLYRMLLAKRTDLIVGDTAAGVAYNSRQLNIPAGTLRQIPVELYHSSLYIAFSRDADDKVVNAWSSALDRLRHTGALERIMRKYDHPVRP
ncbi:ABC transporter substrate-binding protein [Pseudomonas baltica]|uniref:substrate-binding periplasmic protein n=1 Tax=Pseudomonas baltica TaxID=2762576 RepID=UPI0028A129CE|nr:ABC transporter substrate-binding protein [Pseudomonas baltica]